MKNSLASSLAAAGMMCGAIGSEVLTRTWLAQGPPAPRLRQTPNASAWPDVPRAPLFSKFDRRFVMPRQVRRGLRELFESRQP